MTPCFSLLRARRERGMTQAALAERAGVAVKTVTRLERGHGGSPEVQTLRQIAAALDVPMDSLFPELLAPTASSAA